MPLIFTKCDITNIFISNPSTSNKIMLHVLGNQGSCGTCGGNKVGVSSPIKMFSIIALMARTNAWTLKLQGVNERLNFQCGETQHQIRLKWSFVLTNIIFNHVGALISNITPMKLRRMRSSISRIRAPNNLLGVTIIVY